jgi:hypothetical protein
MASHSRCNQTVGIAAPGEVFPALSEGNQITAGWTR